MRLLEEQSRLEKRVEESERKGEEIELRLEDELCSVRSRLAAKEEVDSPSSFVQATEMGTCSAIFSFQELSEAREQLEELESRRLKQSPDTSSSFDFLPLSSSLQSTADSHFVRPRAFSACHQVFELLHFPGSITFQFSGLARERWRSTGPFLRRSLQSGPWC